MLGKVRPMSDLTDRRLEERERRRLDILDAAEAVAGVVGIEAMTMDQVARKARVSRALLYVYFKDKPDLVIGICLRALQQLQHRFEGACAARVRGLEQVEACGRSYVAYAQEFPVRFEALAHFEAHMPSGEQDPGYEGCLAAGEATQRVIAAAIAQGMRDASIRSDLGSPVLLGLTLWGLMHGLIQLTMKKSGGLEREGVSAEQLIEQGFRLALSALALAPPSTSVVQAR